MKLEKKHKIAIAAVAGVAVISVAYWLLIARPKKKNANLYKTTDETKGETETTKTSYVPESFPLKKGYKGENVKLLQKKLGVTVDGLFGIKTETALFQKLGITQIDKATLDNFDKAIANRNNLLNTNTQTTKDLMAQQVLLDQQAKQSQTNIVDINNNFKK